jgi:RHH-type transcriptional regulator, proline utilization regulon repressor / proline dehydrogenase / delta 1-pyrroline-5-carboxylate dehydrogenase
LAGPVGERNIHGFRPRGRIGVVASDTAVLRAAVGAALAAGNTAVVEELPEVRTALGGHPTDAGVTFVSSLGENDGVSVVLTDARGPELTALARRIAAWSGPIVGLQGITAEALAAGEDFALGRLVDEVVITTNTAAAGGNASLMSIG